MIGFPKIKLGTKCKIYTSRPSRSWHYLLWLQSLTWRSSRLQLFFYFRNFNAISDIMAFLIAVLANDLGEVLLVSILPLILVKLFLFISIDIRPYSLRVIFWADFFFFLFFFLPLLFPILSDLIWGLWLVRFEEIYLGW